MIINKCYFRPDRISWHLNQIYFYTEKLWQGNLQNVLQH